MDVISEHRAWMKAHPVSGPAWWLAMLWVGLGVAWSGYAFVWSLQPVTNSDGDLMWAGEPRVVSYAYALAVIAWLLLTIPVLIAGLVRLLWRKPRDGSRVAGWVAAWAAGVALMGLAAFSAGFSPPVTYPCAHWGHPSWCTFYGWGPSVVVWPELPLCAAFLALGVVMASILARPARPQG